MKNQIIKALVNNGRIPLNELSFRLLKCNEVTYGAFCSHIFDLIASKNVILSIPSDFYSMPNIELSNTCQPSDFI